MSQDPRDKANLGLIKKAQICISESCPKACGRTRREGRPGQGVGRGRIMRREMRGRNEEKRGREGGRRDRMYGWREERGRRKRDR